MGCNTSQEAAEVALLMHEQEDIKQICATVLAQSEAYRNAAITIFRVLKDKNTPEQVVRNSSPLRLHFVGQPIPPQITDPNASMLSMLSQMATRVQDLADVRLFNELRRRYKTTSPERIRSMLRQHCKLAMEAAALGLLATETQVVLPAGNWVPSEGTPFYWSEDEKLFYHPPSCQFYDPNTDKWYDPAKEEWYDENESEEAIAPPPQQ